MSDEYREIEVVEVGSGPPRPARPPRSGNRTDVLLTLIVVGVFVGAACSAFTAWTVYGQAQDQRELNCVYLTPAARRSGRTTTSRTSRRASPTRWTATSKAADSLGDERLVGSAAAVVLEG